MPLVPAQTEHLSVFAHPGGAVALVEGDELAFELSPVGARVLAECDGVRPLDVVAAQLDLSDDELQHLLVELETAGLVTATGLDRPRYLLRGARPDGAVTGMVTVPGRVRQSASRPQT